MASQYFLDPDEERRLIEASNLQDQRLQALRESATPQLAQNIGAIAKAYPNISPGVAVSLGKAGKSPNDPAVKEAVRRSALNRGIRGVVRTAFTALETPLQEVQAGLRKLTHASDVASQGGGFRPGDWVKGFREDQFGQSTGALAIKAAIDPTEKVRLGSGFFSGGKIREQHVKAQAKLNFRGDSITTGKLFGHVVSEPGEGAYKVISGLVDATVQLGADPVGTTLGVASKFRAAGKVFATEPVSLAPNIRKLAEAAGLVNGVRKTNLPEVTKAWLDAPDTQIILKKLALMKSADEIWKSSNKQFGAKLSADLADADTVEDVRKVLQPQLGIQKSPARPVVKPIEGFRRTKESVRLLAAMPGRHFDLDDIDDSVEQLDRLQKGAKLPLDVISKNNEALMRSNGSVEAADVIFKTGKDIAAHVASNLINRTNFLSKGVKPSRGGFTEAEAIAKAKKITNYFPETNRELVKFFVEETGGNAKVVGTVLDDFGWALPTPHAFVEYTRLIPMPDVQALRSATSRFPNLFMNPQVKLTTEVASLLTSTVWKPMVLLRGAYITRVVGEEQGRMAASGLVSLYNHPMSYISQVLGRKTATDELGNLFDEAPEFQKAMTGHLQKIDPSGYKRLSNRVNYRKTDEHYNWAWADELSKLASDPIHREVAGKPIGDVKEWFFTGAGQKFRKDMAAAVGREPLLTREGADAYIDTVSKRVGQFTKGDEDLVEMIAKGRQLKPKDQKAFIELLAGKDGPEIVPGEQFHKLPADKAVLKKLDNGVKYLMHATMEVPTNTLSRGVTFRQFYKKRMDELKSAGTKLTDEEMDVVAKGFALDETRKLLYDMHEKGQAADILRVIAPFAEAWKEVLSRWAKIGYENPSVARRFQQGVEGARGSGVFYPDDASGEEMFAYPGGRALTQALMGIPIKMEGRVGGLSLAGQILPGLGPVAAIPVGKIIPDKPEWDSVKDVLLPFGEPDLSKGIIESHFPAYLKRFATAMKADEFSDRVFANTVGDISNYLVANKGYTVDTPEAQEQLLQDAKSKAKGLFLIRGLAQFVLPTGPQPKFLAEDKNGKLHTATLLAQELRRLYETKDSPEEAIGAFLDRFGEDSYLYLQPKSRDLIPGIPVTAKGTKWVRSNPDIANKYPNVYGMFAPEGGDFDFEAYNRYLETGAKERLLPKERYALANHRIASMVYEEAKAKVGDSPSADDAEWLREIKNQLMTEYPGYNATTLEKKNPKAIVLELRAALKNPILAKTDAGKGLALYMEARGKAEAEAKNRGRAGFGSSDDTRDIRDWLRDVSLEIEQQHPGFSKLWDLALSKELKNDDPQETDDGET